MEVDTGSRGAHEDQTSCGHGRSHCAEEWAENDDIAMGAAVLFEAVRDMDKTLKQIRE